MGLGTNMKETTLHHFRDPLLDVVSSDQEVNLRGIILVGSPDDNGHKYFVSDRCAELVGALGVEGAILSCNGFGNNHVDYANTIDGIEQQGIPVAALSLCPASDFVVQNEHLGGVINFHADYGQGENVMSGVLARHTVTKRDAEKALAFLKLRMRQKRREK